jgi:hypothetical protein
MNPDLLFDYYKKQIIKKLGKKALDDVQLNKLGKELFGKKFIGVFSQDQLPTRSGYYIINTDTSKKINSNSAHWVAIVQTKKTLYIYDSFGRFSKNVLKIISKNNTKKIVDSRHDAEQFGYTEVCGHLSVAFLCVANDLGIKQALKI